MSANCGKFYTVAPYDTMRCSCGAEIKRTKENGFDWIQARLKFVEEHVTTTVERKSQVKS